MAENNITVRFQPEAECQASSNQIRYRAQSGARPSSSNRTAANRMSTLLTQSFVGASMLHQPRSLRCPRCNHSHKGLCPGTRPKSVFVESHSFDSDSSDWLEAEIARRKSIDTSELGDKQRRSSSNIWDNIGLALDDKRPVPLARHQVLKTVGEEEEEEVVLSKNIDGGYAWVILAVVFIINSSTFGTARAYGLIFEKMAREGGLTRSEAALPFTIMGAVENMSGPVCGCLLALFGSWRLTVVSGSILVTLGHLLAALWANSRIAQLLSMGLMCGFGLSFVSISFFQINNAYFNKYRNAAFGIGMTGAAFGTLVISPMCQYFLDNYEGTRMCYLALGLCIAPNIPLAMLLKPVESTPSPGPAIRSRPVSVTTSETSMSSTSTTTTLAHETQQQQPQRQQQQQVFREQQVDGTSGEQRDDCRTARSDSCVSLADIGILTCVKRIVSNPYFHLIWPTQLLFCWFNFVYGMTIFDFAKDRGMGAQHVSYLIPCWAIGQLFGRLFLSSLVDLKLLTYKTFTIICFANIGATTFLLNYTRLDKSEYGEYQYLIVLALVFILSMFIALLYILLNGLVVSHVEILLQPMSLGISSFTGSFLLLLRARFIGHYRDAFGNYDAMLTMLTYVSICAALVWLILPGLCIFLKDLPGRIKRYKQSKLAKEEEERNLSVIVLRGNTNPAMTMSSEALESK